MVIILVFTSTLDLGIFGKRAIVGQFTRNLNQDRSCLHPVSSPITQCLEHNLHHHSGTHLRVNGNRFDIEGLLLWIFDVVDQSRLHPFHVNVEAIQDIGRIQRNLLLQQNLQINETVSYR